MVCWPLLKKRDLQSWSRLHGEELTEQSDLQPRPQLRSQVLNNGTAVESDVCTSRNRAVHFTCLSHTCVQGVRESAGARLRQQKRVGKQEERLASIQTHTHTNARSIAEETMRSTYRSYGWQHGSGSLALSQRSFGI